MKKIFIYLLFSSLLSVTFFSCKKYEDGNYFGLVSKSQRVAGDWSYASVVSTDAAGNNTDQTATYAGYVLSLTAGGHGTSTTPLGQSAVTWYFSGDQDHIYITVNNVKTKYKISLLQNKKMNLKYEATDGSYTKFNLEQ